MPTFPSNIKVDVKGNAASKFKKINNAVKPLQDSFRKVNNSFKSFQTKTAGVRKTLNKTGAGMRKVGGAMTLGLTAPIALFGKGIFTATANFDRAMNNVEAKAKLGTKSIADLEAQARELGATTKFSAGEAADAMGFLAQAGFDTDKIFQAMPGTLALAAASNTDIARTADVASNIMGAFKIEAKDMTKVADAMARTMAGSNVDMEQLAEAMKVAGPNAKKFGLDLEGTLAAVGMLGNVGIQGSMAGTALKNSFLNLAAPTPKATELLEKMGVATKDAGGNMRGFEDIMLDVGKGLKNLGTGDQLAVMKEIFGKIGVTGATELVAQMQIMSKTVDGKTVPALTAFTDEVRNGKKGAKEMADTMQKGSAGAMTRFGSAFEGLQIAIGKSGFVEFITDIISGLTDWISGLSKSSPQLLKWGTIILSVVAALGPLIAMIGFTLSGVAGMISAFGIIAPVVTTAVTAFAAFLPVLAGILLAVAPVIAIVGGLAFIANEVITSWGAVRFFFVEMWDEIGALFQKGVARVIGFLPDFVKKKLGISADFDVDKIDAEIDKKRLLDQQLNLNESNSQQQIIDKNLGDLKGKFGFGNTTTTEKSEVIITLPNMPKGAKVDTSKIKDKNVTTNVGFQGATS